LSELAGSIGMEAAARRWRRVHQAVIDLDRRIRVLDLPCGWAPRPELYLAGSRLDEVGLRKEGQARQAAGLPSAFLEAGEVAGRFDIAARAALLSDAAFEVDPVALTLSLLAMARRRGASLTFPINVSDVEPQALGARLRFDGGGELTAGQVVLATGYEAARADLPEAFTLGSSFAIATAPGVAPRWAQKAMIWEASDPYLYARQTADGRVIVGGEDEDLVDAVARDAMIADKATILKRKAERMLDSRPLEIDCAWAATFGSSPDGLPAIGRARSNRSLWLASGFGGNGVSFASLAADLICAELSGAPDPGATDFDPYRFEAG
ncbi:FAD-dependent oxidoreductase, partial [Phenylobacterium sp.]|uniref:NAD(P)/FAD-dependent oxidoreductase n=1 Tax=Phenylobacterium sp. TaxID=1871053 RepID=UPI00286B8962